MIDFEILATGSKGNAVVINKTILIDCGVPFRHLQDHFRQFQLVLLTHIHGDHFNKSTIKKLAIERPTLRFGCCEWLVSPLVECGVEKAQIDVYSEQQLYNYGIVSIIPFNTIHNVPNCGYKLQFPTGEKVIFATDTNSLSHVTAENYDLYLIEANYTEDEILERIRNKQEIGQFCYEYEVLNNHLSKEKADNWLYSQMGNKSKYVYLHGHVGE